MAASRYGSRMTAPALHPELVALTPLLGIWRGHGEGRYPTIDPFEYDEEVGVSHVGKPFFVYGQRTWAADDRRPLHAESGYWRSNGAGRIELVVAHPTGVVEVEEGTVETTATGLRLSLATTGIARTASAKEITELRRELEIDGDVLRYRLDMAAVGQPLLLHLDAVLHRTG